MIKPIKNRVLVRQDPAKDRVGSIYVPQGSEDHGNMGTVEAVGSEVKDVKVGDRVIFKRKPDSALNPDTREGSSEYDDILVLPEDNILAVLES